MLMEVFWLHKTFLAGDYVAKKLWGLVDELNMFHMFILTHLFSRLDAHPWTL